MWGAERLLAYPIARDVRCIVCLQPEDTQPLVHAMATHGASKLEGSHGSAAMLPEFELPSLPLPLPLLELLSGPGYSLQHRPSLSPQSM
jgi:hypothetical protein